MMVAGEAGRSSRRTTRGKPDVGTSLLQAYADDKVDIAVGLDRRPVALAMLPVAEEYKKILLVEPAVPDLDHRRQVEQVHLPHRPQPSQDARANAAALDAAALDRHPG